MGSLFIVSAISNCAYYKASGRMRTDFIRKYAAFSGQNPAQQTSKRKEFCRLL